MFGGGAIVKMRNGGGGGSYFSVFLQIEAFFSPLYEASVSVNMKVAEHLAA